jgi:hypothetical protein
MTRRAQTAQLLLNFSGSKLSNMANRSNEIGGLNSDIIRTESEIIDRTFALSAVIAVANGANADEVRDWLHEENLESLLTKRELTFS